MLDLAIDMNELELALEIANLIDMRRYAALLDQVKNGQQQEMRKSQDP